MSGAGVKSRPARPPPRPGRRAGTRRSPARRASWCPTPRRGGSRPGRVRTGARGVGDLGDAVVDLVAGHRRAQRAAPRAAEDLLRAEPDAHRQQAEPVDRAAARLHRVVDLAGQHLVAAADAEHRAAGPGPSGDRGGQAAVPQPGQVGDGGPGPGQHHQVRVGQVGRAGGEPDQHAGLGRQRVHVGEVADPGQPDHRDPELRAIVDSGRVSGRRCRAERRGSGCQSQRILDVEPEAVLPGQDAVHGAAGELAEHGQAAVQQFGGAAELVDHEAGDERLVFRREQGQRAVHGGEHPAAVDVAGHDDRQAGRAGQAHVGDVGIAQVDLGRAARALADDHVVGVPQPGQAVERDLAQPRRVGAVADRVGFGLGVAEYDDLAAPVTARLEQDRVHVGGRLDARRGRLHRLSPADFGPVQGHERVQRHVLRLERRHLHALPGQPPAQPGDQHALARVRPRPGDQQRPSHGCRLLNAAFVTCLV